VSAEIIDLKSKRTKAVVDQLRAFGVGAEPESSFARTCLELAISTWKSGTVRKHSAVRKWLYLTSSTG
jgi:hypothetical protein